MPVSTAELEAMEDLEVGLRGGCGPSSEGVLSDCGRRTHPCVLSVSASHSSPTGRWRALIHPQGPAETSVSQ